MYYMPVRRSIWAICVLCAFFVNVGRAEAQVINEIFYSPSSKQWVEIYNSTDSDIDLLQYKILDNGAAANGHSISSAQPGGSTILPSHEYGVVAKDVSSVSSTYVFKSPLGIKTSGDTVSLKKSSNVVDTAQFSDNAVGNGKSLQKFGAGWSASTPTPGLANVLDQAGSGAGEESTSTATTENNSSIQVSDTPVNWSSHYSFVPAQNDTASKLSVSAGRERLASTHEAIHFKAILNTNDPNTYYEWNFGDGTTDTGRVVDHIYQLAGDYIVILNVVLFDNEAVSRTKVKVIDPNIAIEEVSADYVSVKNNSKFEINLYGWQITDGVKVFKFPKDTIITSGSMVRFPAKNINIDTLHTINIGRVSDAKGEFVASSTAHILSNAAGGKNASEIQAISDRIIELNKELDVAIRSARESSTESQPIRLENKTNYASAMTSIPPSNTEPAKEAPKNESKSWYGVIKRFFLGNK